MKSLKQFLKESKQVLVKEDVDVRELASTLSGLIYKQIGISVNINIKLDGEYIRLSSNDISSKTKPTMFRTLNITGTGKRVNENEYWMPIEYEYKHFDGGSNGSDISTVWFDNNGEILKYEPKF